MKVAILGAGWVGKSMKRLFPDADVYHPSDPLCPSKESINTNDVAFICVPTPFDGYKLDTSIIRDSIKWLKTPLIVIRSTVNPGDCDKWSNKYHKNIVFQPEYLGETANHPLLNEKNTPFIILGGTPDNRRKVIDLYTTVYNANIKIREVSLIEAEIIKLSENRAIAWKMMQAQELYDVCEKAGVDYYTIREAVYGDDPRFNRWFTFIYKDKRGFNNSKCLVKDVPAWCAWAESVGYKPDMTRLLVTKSNEYDLYQNK